MRMMKMLCKLKMKQIINNLISLKIKNNNKFLFIRKNIKNYKTQVYFKISTLIVNSLSKIQHRIYKLCRSYLRLS